MLNSKTSRLDPGGTIGILGGGQLGRMTSLAAAPLGYGCHIYTPEEESPAGQVSEKVTVASYEDENALRTFAEKVDVITYEFENIPLDSALFLQKLRPVYPDPSILGISQHRGAEKQFALDNGVEVAPYEIVTNKVDLREAIDIIGMPSILKTCRFGYDGKGQSKISDIGQVAQAWEALSTTDAILEKFVEFEKEISVIIARNITGECSAYPPAENNHKNHILDTTIVPANITNSTHSLAIAIATNLAQAMDLVGLLAVEMFVLPNGKVVMNEIAPRPHNSGHWTQDGARTSQFEQFVRAITGQKLGSTEIIFPTKMKNLIGDDVNDWFKYIEIPNAKIHLYGKKESKVGRKMGHINILGDNDT
ncbi:MAG: 5-(carboxyamino)imidazole ribonucleotide synthase [Rhodospirillaceae bacterium]|nr:5-(carboxyamino)imidazole ribonucleotide synthase [Rhodospirillaceae bacterium]